MSEKKIVIPEAMEVAARRAYEVWRNTCRPEENFTNGAVVAVEAALRWLSENPIVPTDEQMINLQDDFRRITEAGEKQMLIAVEWQRRMFLAPEPKMPEEINHLRAPLPVGTVHLEPHELDRRLLEAFRRGQKAGSK